MLCWMGSAPLTPGARLVIKHTTRTTRARIEELDYRVDINTLEHEPAEQLDLNEIGRVRIRTGSPLMADPYARNRTTGSFILIDECEQRHGRGRDDPRRKLARAIAARTDLAPRQPMGELAVPMWAQAREDPVGERGARGIPVVVETRLLHRFSCCGGLAEPLLTGLRSDVAAVLLGTEVVHID